jgi:hypothetical protein
MTTTRGIGFVLALILGFAPEARAITFNEIGDAGQLPAFAQAAGVVRALTGITGSISGPTDVDMFAITVQPGFPGHFSATTFFTSGSLVDTQLFLFSASGRGVLANDDGPDKSLRSTVGIDVTGGPALFFLAISGFDVDPVSSGGAIFPGFPFTGIFGPTGEGGGSAITGWQGFGGTGTYSIDLHVSPVPEPATLLLVGTTMAGLGLARLRQWRRKRESGAQA